MERVEDQPVCLLRSLDWPRLVSSVKMKSEAHLEMTAQSWWTVT